jgi:uncharacterized protein (UPF0261 family)
MIQVGKVMAEKLNRSQGPVTVAVPLKGFSDRNRAGDLFYDPGADGAFLLALKKKLLPEHRVVEIDAHLNDEVFASRACDLLFEMMDEGRKT